MILRPQLDGFAVRAGAAIEPEWVKVKSWAHCLEVKGFKHGTRLLAPGARLPSVRQCAQQHGVSPSTVVAAYDRLLALGVPRTWPAAVALLKFTSWSA